MVARPVADTSARVAADETVEATSRKDDAVKSIKRGLDVLTEINRSGGIRAGEIAQRLGLARPTVYRLLNTLEGLGYVARSASDERFRVTRRASSLGDGYDPGVVVCETAAPVLAELGRRLVWPIDLSTYENAAMVIQETTHARSPLSIDRGMIGRRLPMLRTSTGRSYLSFCPEAELNFILKHLRRMDDADDRPFLEERALTTMIEQTRARGYAIRDAGEYNPKTSSIAVPIRGPDHVLGCFSVIWIRSALAVPDAIAQFLEPMQQAAVSLSQQQT